MTLSAGVADLDTSTLIHATIAGIASVDDVLQYCRVPGSQKIAMC